MGHYFKSYFIKRALIILTTICLFQACKKSDESRNSVDCGGTTKSFAADVKPIVQASCAFDSDCHGTSSTSGPGSLLTYDQIFSVRSIIRSEVVSGDMPKGASLSAAEKNAIACWVDNGAPNN